MKVLITGVAGFIGFHLAKELVHLGNTVLGFDNLNDYYEVSLKKSRLDLLSREKGFNFVKADISCKETLNKIFADFCPEIVVNLAAQAGVRYSIDNPGAYIDSNIVGFFNVLEACRSNPIKHLIYASSSSVYGNQRKTPFSTNDSVDCPISLYAATKKSNELMAYTYSHLYSIPTTGLRFFTVYGPWGRPDMAYFSFTKKLVKGEVIQVFNHGDMKRDFTYINDIVQGIVSIMDCPPEGTPPAKVYNIGNNKPEDLMHFIKTLEQALIEEKVIDKPAVLEFLPMQPGDVYQTYADIAPLAREHGFKPTTSIEEGLRKFAQWYKSYYFELEEKKW